MSNSSSTGRGTPFLDFVMEYRRFLKEKGFQSPIELADEVRDAFRRRKIPAPSRSMFWEAFYGHTTLSKPVLIYLMSKYGFQIQYWQLFESEDIHGRRTKANSIKLPGQRELRLMEK